MTRVSLRTEKGERLSFQLTRPESSQAETRWGRFVRALLHRLRELAQLETCLSPALCLVLGQVHGEGRRQLAPAAGLIGRTFKHLFSRDQIRCSVPLGYLGS